MILSDIDILNAQQQFVMIEPFDNKFVQPASYDLHLSSHVGVVAANTYEFQEPIIDVKFENRDLIRHRLTHSMVLESGGFILGSTVQKVRIPAGLAARVEGKSSLGRIGLCVHVTAGFIDPGFHGHITLEIVNHSPYAVRIYAGMPIAQLSFELLTQPAAKPYGKDRHSKYQDQSEVPQASQFWKNFPDNFLEV